MYIVFQVLNICTYYTKTFYFQIQLIFLSQINTFSEI